MLRAGSHASPASSTSSWPVRQRPPPLDRRRALACRAAGFPPPPPNAPPNNTAGGFRLLERANALLPQGVLVATARTGWRIAWQAMVRELAPQRRDGAYVRPGYAFADRISAANAEQAAGASSSPRYVLYVGNACPWCHRVLLTLALREMRDQLVRVVDLLDDPEKATRGGWIVSPAANNGAPDPVFGARDLFGVYDAASPGFRGRCTAPLLIDARSRRPVCNESAELVRNLVELRPAAVGAEASGKRWANQANLLPEEHRPEIERLNALIYEKLANGVYRAGFATSQQAFDDALSGVRSTLAELEARLQTQRFLCGGVLTEADVRLFPALCRLDAVYHPFFLRGAPLRLSGGGGAPVVGGLAAVFPALHAYLNDVWDLPGVSATIDISAARLSYWRNLFPLNPGGIVPPGPNEDEVRRGAQGESGAEVAARRRRVFGGGGGEAVPRSAEEVCARF